MVTIIAFTGYIEAKVDLTIGECYQEYEFEIWNG